MQSEEWLEIIPVAAAKEAQRKFQEWKVRQLALGRSIPDEILRVDHCCGADGRSYLRYLVLRKYLES